jgi:hypothetical protein
VIVIVCVGEPQALWLVPPQLALRINGLIVYPEPQLQALKFVNSIASAGIGLVTLQF